MILEPHGQVAFAAHAGGFAVGAAWVAAFFGWNNGIALEEKYNMVYRSEDVCDEGRIYTFRSRPLGYLCGALIGLIVMSGVGDLALTYGLINKTRPDSVEEVEEIVEDYVRGRREKILDSMLEKQNVEDLQADVKKRTQDQDFMEEYVIFKPILRHIRARLELDRKGLKVRGWSSDYKAYAQREYPTLPENSLAIIDKVVTRKLFFKSGEKYEFLCSSKETPRSLIELYQAELVRKRWLVAENRFDEKKRRGYLKAGRDDMTVRIAVLNEEIFPGEPTTVYYLLDMSEEIE
jgi:hypothetical protein